MLQWIEVDKSAPALVADKKLLKHRDYVLLQDAESVLSHSRKAAENMLEAAKTEIQAKAEAGYRDGFQKAQEEAARQTLATKKRVDDLLASLNARLPSLVNGVVRKIIADSPEDKKIEALLQRGLQPFSELKKVAVKVHPEQRQRVAQIVTGITESPQLNVITDAKIPPEQIHLESQLGVVTLNLEQQISTLENLVTNWLDSHY